MTFFARDRLLDVEERFAVVGVSPLSKLAVRSKSDQRQNVLGR